MKTILILLAAACLTLPSCVNKGSPTLAGIDSAKVATLGNAALTIANKRGAVSDKEAAIARQAGVLLLTVQNSDNPLATISETAVTVAVKEGTLTQEEADLLREIGTVALKPSAGPSNPLLPPAP